MNINSNEIAEQQQQTDSILAAQRQENPEAGMILSTLDPTSKVEYISEDDLDTMNFAEAKVKQWELFSEHYKKTEIRNSEVALDSLNYNNSRFNKWYYRKAVDAERFSLDPDLFWNYFYSKLPFIIFFYLPVFALFIWLLYLRRPFTYMEHLIFTFHNQTTWFVLYGIAVGLNSILSNTFFTWVATFLFAFYLYKAFRRFYGQGRVKTLLKFIIINLIFFTLAIIAALFSALASFAIY